MVPVHCGICGKQYMTDGVDEAVCPSCWNKYTIAAARHEATGAECWEATVNHPPHYTKHPSGIECIQITEHMGFCLGNVIKYVWRAGEKGNELADLHKARWYLDRHIAKLEGK